MSITSPSVLRAFLSSLGKIPKRGLSQNFLIDQNIVKKIMHCAGLSSEDVVLEVGPGPGALTEAMVKQASRVVAVEQDPDLARALSRFQGVEVIADDIRKLATFPQYPVKVVANLPYHLTSSILAFLLPKREVFSSLTVMVQKEVAKRIVAKPSSADYGSFSVFVQFYADVTYAFSVGHRCFYPMPKVDSAVIHLVLKAPQQPLDEEKFFSFVRLAFSQRRKMLTNTLGKLYSSTAVAQALEEMGENPKARAENLSLEAFLQLYQVMSSMR